MSISTNTSRAEAVNFAVAALVGLGGAFGYAKAKSSASLVSGGVFAAIFFLSGYLRQPYLSIAASLVLSAVMGQRYLNTRKPMPALLLTVVGVGNLAFQAYAIRNSHLSIKLK